MAATNPSNPPTSSPAPITAPTSTTAAATETQPPISPVQRSSSFQHKTSPAVPPTHSFIETNTPAINDTPVELDSVPASLKGGKRRNTAGEGEGGVVSPNLGEEEDINQEFLGEGKDGVSKELRAKRAAMLASRSKDPAVLVDLPQEPTAEEVEAAKSGEGTVTPGLANREFEKLDRVDAVGER